MPYDAAYKGIPTLDHLAVASLSDVKLRLGRMSGGKQKGVDSLIVRDLMVLGRERAIATAFLLAGDEDLREGVKDAQDFGVRVVLVGIRSTDPRGNQAATLVQEADEHVVLDADLWGPFLAKKVVEEPATLEEPLAVAEPDVNALANQAGTAFAKEWAEKALPEEVAELLALAPAIPPQLDTQLMTRARSTVGDTRGEIAKVIRAAFWRGIRGESS